MTSDAAPALPASTDDSSTSDNSTSPLSEVNCALQIRLKQEEEQIVLSLPTETEFSGGWSELWPQFQHRLNGSERFWQSQTTVFLQAKDRLLDIRQLQEIADALIAVKLQLKLVKTSRRQTAVAAATAGYSVQQEEAKSSLSEQSEKPVAQLEAPLYLHKTIRSGVEVRHPGTLIIIGDVNPGGALIAAGDILVWGCLRGVAHAGAQGDRQRSIMALAMKPTQLRIANAVARAPEQSPRQLEPEVAHITTQGIRITRSNDFLKNYHFSDKVRAWQNK